MNPPEITMNKDNSLQSIPRIIFFLLMITLVVYSSSLSIRYRREEQIKKIESEKKIYLTGKFEPSEREDFVLISPENAFGANDMYLRKEAYGTFIPETGSPKKADRIQIFKITGYAGFNSANFFICPFCKKIG